jgi:hypothetical protein
MPNRRRFHPVVGGATGDQLALAGDATTALGAGARAMVGPQSGDRITVPQITLNPPFQLRVGTEALEKPRLERRSRGRG